MKSKVPLVYLGNFFKIKIATCNECHGGLKGDFCKFFVFFKSSPIDSGGFWCFYSFMHFEFEVKKIIKTKLFDQSAHVL